MAHFRVYIFHTAMVLAVFGLAGCASTGSVVAPTDELDRWQQHAIAYEKNLPTGHPDRTAQLLTLSPEIKKALQEEFEYLPPRVAARSMAQWLIDPDGHGMEYNSKANFSPADAFRERRGNCLSFTILLASMAAEIGVNLQYNEVDLPDVWDLDENRNGMMLYRHINAVYKSNYSTMIFDLAIRNYDARYPQRIIAPERAIALLHNNFAMDELFAENYEAAFHHMKLAIGMDQNNSDIWGNLGVLFKRVDRMRLAEQSFLHALSVDSSNSAAAGNLEHFYRKIGENSKANRYAKMAKYARSNNPYFQYQLAERSFKEREFKSARKAVKRAKFLHNKDSRFFALSSQIEKQLKNYSRALKDLDTAYHLSNDKEERGRYLAKAELVAKLMAERAAKRDKLGQDGLADRILDRSGL